MEPSGHRSIEEAADSEDVGIHPNGTIETQQATQSKLCPQEQNYQLTRDKKKRTIKPPKRFGYVDMIAFALAAAQDIDVKEPKTYKEAVQGSYKEN